MQAICLHCKRSIPLVAEQGSGQYSCDCGTVIPYNHGILQFAQEDAFYEGKFVETHQQSNALQKLTLTILRLISIDGNEERMWRKSVAFIRKNTERKQLQVLNIGSGGGHGFLNDLGSVTAIDLSLKSLLNAQAIYDFCYQADARQIPFPDESFDLVFSSHLLGHIPLEQKQDVIKEIYRVTKAGGFSLHSAECEADNALYERAKRYPDLYRKYFQDIYGHYGLEYPSVCKKRFRNESFEPIFETSDYCKGMIRAANSYKIFFGAEEFREKDRMFTEVQTRWTLSKYSIGKRDSEAGHG
jgi:ubiquinone/menaquinone biosynthesis C-methylase UbiE